MLTCFTCLLYIFRVILIFEFIFSQKFGAILEFIIKVFCLYLSPDSCLTLQCREVLLFGSVPAYSGFPNTAFQLLSQLYSVNNTFCFTSHTFHSFHHAGKFCLKNITPAIHINYYNPSISLIILLYLKINKYNLDSVNLYLSMKKIINMTTCLKKNVGINFKPQRQIYEIS